SREDTPEQVLSEVAPGVAEILQVDVEFRIGVHVEDALRDAASHGRDVPGAFAEMGVGAIKAPLGVGEPEVADEALRDAVGLKPGESSLFRGSLLAIEELKAADAQRGARAGTIAQIALAE